MTMTEKELQQMATRTEPKTWFPEGRAIDGATYSYVNLILLESPDNNYLNLAMKYFQIEAIQEQIQKMGGNEEAMRGANWWLWASYCASCTLYNLEQ